MSDLDRAVVRPARVKGEPFPGHPTVHRHNLRGKEGEHAANQEDTLLQDGAGMRFPAVEGVLVVHPAGPRQLGAGGVVAGQRETGEDVQGGAVHVKGERGEGAACSLRPQLH